MYVSILRTEMRKAHLLFTLLTTLFRKQASKNLSLWCHKSISLMTYITGKTLVFGKKVLSEKKKTTTKKCNCIWGKQQNWGSIWKWSFGLTKTLCLCWRCYRLPSVTPLSCKMWPLFHCECHLLPAHYWSAPSVDCNPAADGWDLQPLTEDQQFA